MKIARILSSMLGLPHSTAKTPSDAAQHNSLQDFMLLRAYYEQHKGIYKTIEHDYLVNYVFPILSDKPVGKDEFERKECEHRLPSIKDSIMRSPIVVEEPIRTTIGEYDFDSRRFSVTLDLGQGRLDRFSHFYYRINGGDSYYRFFVEVDDIDRAKLWKSKIALPELHANIMITPQYYCINHLSCCCIQYFSFLLLGIELVDRARNTRWELPDV